MPSSERLTFKDLGVCEEIDEALGKMGWTVPTPIQTEAIPVALKNRTRDIIGLASTGSGKTGTFVIPILQDLLDCAVPYHSLVISPTRELSLQIADVVEEIGRGMKVRVAKLIGGIDTMQQQIMLAKQPHVIIATPGRLIDHMNNTNGFSLTRIKCLVLDEADKLLDLDFQRDLDIIISRCTNPSRRTFFFSATMSAKVERLQKSATRDPIRIETSVAEGNSEITSVGDNLVQEMYVCTAEDKAAYLVTLLQELAGKRIIIFANKIVTVAKLTFMLRNLGMKALALHGQLDQSQRLAALEKFRLGEASILLASDVAARGIDVKNVEVVLNYDIPVDGKSYVHRIGRCARQGSSGLALTCVTQYDIVTFTGVEKMLGLRMAKRLVPTDSVSKLRVAVEEAQRTAEQQMKEFGYGSSKRGTERDQPGSHVVGSDMYNMHRFRQKKHVSKKQKQ